MAIRTRRGRYSEFDPSKMVSGEYATVQSGDPNTSSGESVYISANTGTVKRLAFVEDVNEIVYNLTDEVAQEFNEQIQDNISAAQTAASNAATSATAAASHVTRFTDADSNGNIVITIGGAT